MQSKRYLTGLLGLLIYVQLQAQKPTTYGAGDIYQMLDRLNVLGTVLYVAAHPDDENTAVIAYFANEKHYRTAYLSATRGDGGQNLIGPEIREGLGIIRTQELLAARRIDGGQQFFSRANDFGYSKNSDETQQVWDRDQVLADFVRVIRTFRPDIIVTRFTETRGGHGHHTTSALLAQEAFRIAGDSTVYPDQLAELDPWSPSRIFWNTSFWFYRGTDEKFDPSGMYGLDIGGYNPRLGRSYTEISALGRSEHKSQGFGSTGTRGENIEYLQLLDGDSTSTEIFGGIDTSWGRVQGAERVGDLLEKAANFYNPDTPEETIDALYNARAELLKIPDQFWKEIKLDEINEVLLAISGTYLEVVANDHAYVPGDSITLQVEAVSRYQSEFELQDIVMEPWGTMMEINQAMEANQKIVSDYSLIIPMDMDITHPYWLNSQATTGMYHVENPSNIGKPENDPVFRATFNLKWREQYMQIEVPVSYKRNDPVNGETYRPVVITPEVMINLDRETLIFGDNQPQLLTCNVIGGRAGVSGVLQLGLPEDWKVEPASFTVNLESKSEEQTFTFRISPPAKPSEVQVFAEFVTDRGTLRKGRKLIEYEHIPIQTYFPESSFRLIRLDLKKAGSRIGYIEGAGDAIPQSLTGIGYEVDMLGKDDVIQDNLMAYDAVILGIRAFNTVDWLSYKNSELFAYVEAGGTLIVQYNTNRRMVTEEIAPYPLTLSRGRVTVEEAEIRILEKDHELLTQPNRITKRDFDGWVQERGLYFPSEWSDQFTPILSSNDPGEEPLNGGLLVAKHGKGYYIYTGYSWFRELPAGVSGAYRIFANMISIGKSEKRSK